MANEYFLLFKTAQSETRCWRNFEHDHKPDIVPIIELTRGRKKPKAGKGIPEDLWPSTPGIFDYQKSIESVLSDFADSRAIILDMTREPSLSCAELSELTLSVGGYSRWRQFCLKMRADGLSNIIPTILINPSDDETADDYKVNVRTQLNSLMAEFGAAAYRASVLHDTDFLYDITLLAPEINQHVSSGRRFILVIDHEFIRTGTGILHALRTSQIIQQVRMLTPQIEIVVLATSFPSNVTELGGEDVGIFRAEETYLYEEIMRQINDNHEIYYGDYGSINPIRNDLVFARGGWRPRIDFPTNDRRFFYYREKRDGATYANHYSSVAADVVADPKFDALSGSWGVQQIQDAAGGRVPSSSPSFWISVRMEVFLQRQASRLFL
jgi:hypothetical protein